METAYLYKAWSDLRSSLRGETETVFRGYYTCAFGSTYICSDALGNESLLIMLDDVAASSFQSPKVSGIGFKIERNDKISKNNPFLKIYLAPGYEIQEAFEAFTVTLILRISKINDTADVLDAVYELSKEYSNFFGKGGKTDLTENEEQGLFGELLVLRELLDHFGDVAINSWTGPDKNRHDFVFEGNNAIEVKTNLKQTMKKITVSNSVQLFNTPNANLYLKLVVLECNPSGSTLGQLVDDIYENHLHSLRSKDDFERKLLEMKVKLHEIPSQSKFLLISTYNYLVNDSFPRITRERICEISPRIYDLKYKINLEGYEEYQGDIYGHLGI